MRRKKVIKIKNKKSAIEMEKIVTAVLVLVVLFVMIFFFTNQFGRGAKGTNTLIDKTNCDCDNDGLKDIVDPCPGSPGEKKEGICPNGIPTKQCEEDCEKQQTK